MLYESTKHRTNESSSAEMAEKFPNFSLGIIQLFNLQFLVAVDLENVNVTDKVDTVTVEKAKRSTKVNIDLWTRLKSYAHPSS